jgi:uncharacterized protein (DUF2141 family)
MGFTPQFGSNMRQPSGGNIGAGLGKLVGAIMGARQKQNEITTSLFLKQQGAAIDTMHHFARKAGEYNIQLEHAKEVSKAINSGEINTEAISKLPGIQLKTYTQQRGWGKNQTEASATEEDTTTPPTPGTGNKPVQEGRMRGATRPRASRPNNPRIIAGAKKRPSKVTPASNTPAGTGPKVKKTTSVKPPRIKKI